MWAQEWNNIYDLVEPYPGEPSLDVGKKPRGRATGTPRRWSSRASASSPRSASTRCRRRSGSARSSRARATARSSATRARGTSTWSGDLRIKMCIEPTEEDFVTIHHELGHDFYFQRYDKLPILFQQGANDGFHEAIGDTIALSVTPDVPEERSACSTRVAGRASTARINQQMKMALDKVAFLPFGLLIDKWRWDVFSGKIAAGRVQRGVVGAQARSTRASRRPSPRSERRLRSRREVPRRVEHAVRALLPRAHLPVPVPPRALQGGRATRARSTSARSTTTRQAGEKLMAMLALGREPPVAGRARGDRRRAQGRRARRCSSTSRRSGSGSTSRTRARQCGW